VKEGAFDVFLSYSRDDQQTAERVAETLHAQGLKVFIDRWSLTPAARGPRHSSAP
jgi:hypothetical protein